MSQPIQNYLDQLAGEAEHHSAGLFSIDYSRALEKVSRRLFEEPSGYLVQWAQAAWLLNAGELRLRAQKQLLEVQLVSEALQVRALEELPQQLHLPLPPPGSPIGHLLRGIHLARVQPGLQLALAYQDPDQGWVEALGGQRQPLPSLPQGPPRLTLALRKDTPTRWAEEKSLLRQRCALSPLAVHWNDTLLNPQVPAIASRPCSIPSLLERFYLSQHPARQLLTLPHPTAVPALCYDLGGGYQDRYSFGKSLLLQWRSPGARAPFPVCAAPDVSLLESDWVQELLGLPREAYALNHGLIRPGRISGSNNFYQILYVANTQSFTRSPFASPQGRFGSKPSLAAHCWMRCPALPTQFGSGSLTLQQYGVLLDPLPLEVQPGLQVFLTPPEPLKTDLSGLTPVDGEELETLRAWVESEAGKIRKELRKALRWNEKYGISDSLAREIHRLHSLDPGE